MLGLPPGPRPRHPAFFPTQTLPGLGVSPTSSSGSLSCRRTFQPPGAGLVPFQLGAAPSPSPALLSQVAGRSL